uniref:hypothetical protein n=1 Tax=Pseudomonas sp. Sample_16 TaxID=2448263 RepID=UPI0019D51FF3
GRGREAKTDAQGPEVMPHAGPLFVGFRKTFKRNRHPKAVGKSLNSDEFKREGLQRLATLAKPMRMES